MQYTSIFEILLKCLVTICGLVIIGFLTFGWIKGLYWDTQLKNKRRYKY